MQTVRLAGLWPAYLFLLPVAAYYTVAARVERRSSLRYLRRVLGPKPRWMWPPLVFRHFVSSGVSLLDRQALIAGRVRMRFQYEGEDRLLETLREGKGAILLGAHVGSWEIGGQMLSRHGWPVNVVVFQREAPALRALFDASLSARRFRVLTDDGDPLRAVTILAALRRGEIVALHGDRVFPGAQAVDVEFLGGTARLPVGPYVLSAISGAPIVHAFAVREGLRRYRFLGFPAACAACARAPESWRRCASEYAARLAWVLERHPFQWYNFFPYWTDDDRV